MAINDGHWHHVALVWKGKTFKDKDGQEHKGELVVYVNNVVLYRGAGQNKGAKEISTSAGTFSLGSGGGGGSSCEAVLASVAVLSRCLDVKGVSILFETPPLRGTEKGLLLYYDFDFEVSDEKPAQEVLNRARKAKAKGGSCGLLKGSARLVFLM